MWNSVSEHRLEAGEARRYCASNNHVKRQQGETGCSSSRLRINSPWPVQNWRWGTFEFWIRWGKLKHGEFCCILLSWDFRSQWTVRHSTGIYDWETVDLISGQPGAACYAVFCCKMPYARHSERQSWVFDHTWEGWKRAETQHASFTCKLGPWAVQMRSKLSLSAISSFFKSQSHAKNFSKSVYFVCLHLNHCQLLLRMFQLLKTCFLSAQLTERLISSREPMSCGNPFSLKTAISHACNDSQASTKQAFSVVARKC